jgi:hypothetical protein
VIKLTKQDVEDFNGVNGFDLPTYN